MTLTEKELAHNALSTSIVDFAQNNLNWSVVAAAIEAYGTAFAAEQVAALKWQPIETAPKGDFMLVHEDGAIRALFHNSRGEWEKPCYPAIINEWGDAVVGKDTQHYLPARCRLEARDGCCESPTHWMPLPAAPISAQEG